MGHLERKFWGMLKQELEQANMKHEARRAEIQKHLPVIFRITAHDVYLMLKEYEEKKQIEQTQRRIRMR